MKRLLRASSFILLGVSGLGLGVVGVRASTECERYIRVLVREKPKHHKVSAETAARWVAWNKAHPNYKPHKMTPKETWEKVNFACEVPLVEKTADLELPTLEAPPVELPPELFPPAAPAVVAENQMPVFPQGPPNNLLLPPAYVPEVPVVFGPVYPAIPVISPSTPVAPAPTPEPGSLVLMTTAVLGVAGFGLKRRLRRAGV